MCRKMMALASATALSVGLIAAVPNALASARPELPKGQIVSSYAQFSQLVSQFKNSHPNLQNSESAHANEVQVIEQANKLWAQSHNQTAYANYLANHGWLVYLPPNSDPSISSNMTISPLSNGGNEVTYTTPSAAYNYMTGDTNVEGGYTWNSSSYIDTPSAYDGYNVGGFDAIGLTFQYLPNGPAYVVNSGGQAQWAAETYNYYGTLENTYYNPNLGNTGSSGQFGVWFSGQDAWQYSIKGTANYYTWYSGIVRVLFGPGWASSEHGQAYFGYEHTWNSTKVTGIGFNLGGTASTLTYGLTLQLNVISNQWATQSGYMTY